MINRMSMEWMLEPAGVMDKRQEHEQAQTKRNRWEIALHCIALREGEGRGGEEGALLVLQISTYAVVGRPSTLGRTSMMMKTGSCEQNLRNMEAIFRSFSFTYYVRTRAVAVVEKKTRRGVSEWSSMT